MSSGSDPLYNDTNLSQKNACTETIQKLCAKGALHGKLTGCTCQRPALKPMTKAVHKGALHGRLTGCTCQMPFVRGKVIL